MAGTQRLLAIAMTFFLTGVPVNGNLEAVGVVVEANHATLGSQAATEGTTIYDGDRLATDAEGTLRLRVGDAVVDLRNRGSAVLHESGSIVASEFTLELLAGAATLSVTARAGEIVACGARVRPVSQVRGVVRVEIVGPRELLVYAQRGPAQISYRDDTETIAEGKAYRVLLNPTEEGAGQDLSPKAPGKRKKALLLIALGAATAVGVSLALLDRHHANAESPDYP